MPTASDSPISWLLTPSSCLVYSKMKVYPEIFMKTKEGENWSQVSGSRCQEKVRSPWSSKQIRGTRSAWTFCLLTPPSCLLYSKMKMYPEMLMKTKEGENRCHVSSAGCQGKAQSPRYRGSAVELVQCGHSAS